MHYDKIAEYFDSNRKPIYRPAELHRVLRDHRTAWQLPHRSADEILTAIAEKVGLRKVTLTSMHYQDETRFVRTNASPYQVALSLKPKSYLTHGTAMLLHRLRDEELPRIYVNHEQSAKPAAAAGLLSQEAVDRAFASPQRQSRYEFVYDGREILVLNGKNTGHFGVREIVTPDGAKVHATDLERTVIDITVRPSYAGSIQDVQAAYAAAKSNLSVSQLLSTLNALGYRYPYHQAVGFYMERAGYDAGALEQIEALGTAIDFYAAYGLEDPQYSERWRLFYPRGL